MAESLLEGEDGPVVVVNRDGASPFVLVCEHAGNRIPKALGRLGLADADLSAHIAWDIGAEPMARLMAEALDAPLLLQLYSRLVIDCNRPPDSPEAMCEVSELTPIPGNRDLTADQRRARIDAVFTPFHDAVARLLDERAAQGRESILVTLHSFTPIYKGFQRPWHVGAQYNRAPELSHTINALLAADPTLVIGDNVPYPVNDATHYTIPVHGEQRGIAHSMIEVRNDLITHPAGQAVWADKLGRVLTEARSRMNHKEPRTGGGD
ncbi:putative N-formylglutamate amidohydrolase [Rhodoligotrophos appendicifer]|uniref:N-formylglutamate amidohydrolase n=1 Tax=Rhodoligotrophos appendicifer TaxID=987056 RepID=UPI0011866409|nr:N-formylglutamate amidohydrolase [Rhodoligotrophos appendicifer]